MLSSDMKSLSPGHLTGAECEAQPFANMPRSPTLQCRHEQGEGQVRGMVDCNCYGLKHKKWMTQSKLSF